MCINQQKDKPVSKAAVQGRAWIKEAESQTWINNADSGCHCFTQS